MDDNERALMLWQEEPLDVIDGEFLETEVREPEMPPAARSFAELIARAVVAQQEAPRLSEQERFTGWALAFDEWLREDPRTGAARPANTVQAYSDAWEDFRRFCPKVPWAVEGLDVKAWVADLRLRPLAAHVMKGLVKNGRRREGEVGLSDGTVNQWLAAISAFYSFCETYEVRTRDGRTVALFDGVNPVKSRAVKRPKTKPFDKAAWLDVEQIRALLQAIRSYATQNAEKALRDYALYLCYISTGARNSEVRLWRWEDIERRGGARFYSWANKGKSGTDEIPADAWAAVEDYLRLTGRLEGMGAGDYIFRPSGDSATRLVRADGSRVVDAATWDRNRPISPQQANANLRFYARRAGLEADQIHLHSLRHSASMLYREAGLGIEERSRLLHHSSISITQIYDHEMAGQRNMGWAKAAGLLGL